VLKKLKKDNLLIINGLCGRTKTTPTPRYLIIIFFVGIEKQQLLYSTK